MLNKQYIRSLAEAERLMDEGKVPWVWAPSLNGIYERLAVAPNIMEDLQLKTGQTINNLIMDAIAVMSLEILSAKLEDMRQQLEDEQMNPDFDFRSMMNEDDS